LIPASRLPSPIWLPTYTVSQTTKYASNYAWWTLTEILNDKRKSYLIKRCESVSGNGTLLSLSNIESVGMRVKADLINVRPPGFSALTLKLLKLLSIELQWAQRLTLRCSAKPDER
jgi:hypothetical protein